MLDVAETKHRNVSPDTNCNSIFISRVDNVSTVYIPQRRYTPCIKNDTELQIYAANQPEKKIRLLVQLHLPSSMRKTTLGES